MVQKLQPAKPVIDAHYQYPFQVPCLDWQLPEWRQCQAAHANAALKIMAVGTRDLDILPLRRYHEDGAVFNAVTAKHGQHAAVLAFLDLRQHTRALRKDCLQLALREGVRQFANLKG